jgi:ribosomal protein S18 acetylase RimI-like enzyme
MVRIEAAKAATGELEAAFAALLPQLNPTLVVPDAKRVRELIDDPAVTVLLARDGADIVGTATVIIYTTPFWIKARIDEVVVDQAARGKGVGEALVNACLDIARKRGAQVAELQSGKQRDAANRLYRRLGFELRESNLYRISLSRAAGAIKRRG